MYWRKPEQGCAQFIRRTWELLKFLHGIEAILIWIPILQFVNIHQPRKTFITFVNYELGAQPFLPQHHTYSEGKGSQDRVKCIWPGCSKFVRKENHTRHVNETHLRKIKTLCTGCGKEFTRSYMKKDHICPAEM
ncbi:hypothetical protein BD769DRAFT_1391865 [Suillus cothurnatus]|nr:hypothetical protein BD769DRAFT_1391865 [Suillus cothurnatus]